MIHIIYSDDHGADAQFEGQTLQVGQDERVGLQQYYLRNVQKMNKLSGVIQTTFNWWLKWRYNTKLPQDLIIILINIILVVNVDGL